MNFAAYFGLVIALAASIHASETGNSTIVRRFVNFWGLGGRQQTSKPWSMVDTSGRNTGNGGSQIWIDHNSKYRWAPPAHRDKVIRVERMVDRRGTGGCTITCPQLYGTFRHPNDCSKFYKCGDQGEVFLRTCPYPLLFNEKTSKCDWPELVACPNPPFNFQHICGRPFGLFAHPLDCRVFFNCWGGFPHLQACPEGLHFSSTKQECELPHLSGCSSGQVIQPLPEPTPGRGGNLPPGVTFTCPIPSGNFPLQNDCTKYILCTNGQPSLESCPRDYLFEVFYEGQLLTGKCLEVFRVSRTCQRSPSVSVCGYVNSVAGMLASPNYPFNYDPNTNCNYIITKARRDVCKVQLTFEDFELETSGACVNDFLQVNDKQFCGMMLPKGQVALPSLQKILVSGYSLNKVEKFKYLRAKLIGDGNWEDQTCKMVLDFPPQTSELRIKFRTDRFMQFRGFNVKVEQNTDCSVGLPKPKTLPPPPQCDYNIPVSTGNISSLFYPQAYNNQLGCTYRFTRVNRNICFLKLRFHDFRVEESVNCISDYLEVAGKRYCGRWPTGFVEIVEFPRGNDQILVQFISNERNNDQGFHIGFFQLECGVPTEPGPGFACRRPTGKFAHPDFCDQYYDCVEYRWTIRTCSLGTLVQIPSTSSADAFCEQANRVNCQSRQILFPQPSTTFRPFGFTCPRGNGNFAHETDCDRYYNCRNYIWTIQLCPSGQLFNIFQNEGAHSNGECLPVNQVFCGARTTAVTPVFPGSGSFRCPRPSGSYRHETYCDKFYFCEQFQSSIQTCPRGELFSVSSSGIEGICLSATQVFCGARTTAVTPGTFQCPQENGFFAHETDCDKYYFCQQFQSSILTCPQGELFGITSGIVGTCTRANQVFCGERTTAKPPVFTCPIPNGQFENPTSCSKFYTCSNFLLDTRSCPEGQLFQTDPTSRFREGSCMIALLVDCKGRSTDTPLVPTDSSSTFRCPAPQGVFPHENDCDKYYNCTNSVPVTRTCPSGELFSIFRVGLFVTGSCILAENVKCGLRSTAPPFPTGNPQVEFQCPASNGVFRHSTQCNIFYRCVNSVAVERFECPEGQIFSNIKAGELQEKCFRPSAIFSGFKSHAEVVAPTKNVFLTVLFLAAILTIWMI